MKLIIDSCVAVKWCFKEEFSTQAIHLQNDEYEILAPDLICSEIGNVIWKKSLKNEMNFIQCGEVYNAIMDHFNAFFDSKRFIEKSIELAIKYNHPVYDCIYISTAMHYNIPLVTADKRMHELGKDTEAQDLFHWIGDYALE